MSVNIYQCQNCSKELSGYQKKFCSCLCSSTFNAKNRVKKDNTVEKSCKLCNKLFKVLPHDPKQFCTGSCSAKYNNKKRKQSGWRHSKETRECLSNINKNNFKRTDTLKYWLATTDIAGPYTKVVKRICAYSGDTFFVHPSTRRKYSNISALKEKHIYSSLCKFEFNVYHFPEHFDIDLLKEFGWYHPVSNPNGVSRDHQISVSYGFKHKIDPNTIAHPANCRLIKHKDNNRKNSKCSITLAELQESIKKWSSEWDSNPHP